MGFYHPDLAGSSWLKGKMLKKLKFTFVVQVDFSVSKRKSQFWVYKFSVQAFGSRFRFTFSVHISGWAKLEKSE